MKVDDNMAKNKGGRPKKYTDAELFENKIKEYFDDKENMPYTLTGLALHLDMDRKSLLNYSKDEKFFPAIKKAKTRVEENLVKNAMIGTYNPAISIFLLKNNHEYANDEVVKINNNVSVSYEDRLKQISDEDED